MLIIDLLSPNVISFKAFFFINKLIRLFEQIKVIFKPFVIVMHKDKYRHLNKLLFPILFKKVICTSNTKYRDIVTFIKKNIPEKIVAPLS